MMNQKRSSTLNQLKVAGILPFLAMVLLAFAQPVHNTVSDIHVSNDINDINANSKWEITVKGKVVDAESDEPVISANVIIVNTTTGTITDNNGDFILKMPAGAELAISYMGYKTAKVHVKDESPLNVRIAPRYYNIKPADASPVRKKPSAGEKEIKGEVYIVVGARPYYQDQQNQALFKKVQNDIQKYVTPTGEKGMVTVHFTVNKQGQLENIYTHESTNPKLNKVAEDMISELKNWEPAKQRGKAVDTRLELTLNF